MANNYGSAGFIPMVKHIMSMNKQPEAKPVEDEKDAAFAAFLKTIKEKS